MTMTNHHEYHHILLDIFVGTSTAVLQLQSVDYLSDFSARIMGVLASKQSPAQKLISWTGLEGSDN